MVSYEVPKPPQGFFYRMTDGVHLATAFVKGERTVTAGVIVQDMFSLQ